MNNRILSLALAFACASLPVAHAQEPPGCSVKSSPKKHSHAKPAQHSEISGKLPKRKVLDLRRHKTAEPEEAPSIPVIASPIYLPQAGTNGTAITASNGYLYVVVGERLYKVNEKTLKTVQVSALGNREVERTTSTATSKRRHKVVASTGDEPSPHKTTKKRRASKTD